MLVWRGGQKTPLDIRVEVIGGGGWFKLERYMPAGSYELAGARMDGTTVDGDAEFNFSDNQLAAWLWSPLSLRLSMLVGNPSKTAMDVFLKVKQAHGVLLPDNGQSTLPVLQNGISLGTVQDNKPGLFDFTVVFW